MNMKNVFAAALLASAIVIVPASTASAQNSFWDIAGSLMGQKTQTTANSAAISALSQTDVQAALREALTLSSQKVVGQLGKEGGYSLDPKIRIPLPPALQPVDRALKAVGMGALTDDLQTRINKAAEAAAPKAKDIFVGAIKKMTIEDAKQILSGPDNAATTYLQKHMSPEMLEAMQPVVTSALADAGAVQANAGVVGQYRKAMPFMPDAKTNLSQYATQKAIDGIFYYVAQEEAAIRQNPAKRSTELIKKVFSAAK